MKLSAGSLLVDAEIDFPSEVAANSGRTKIGTSMKLSHTVVASMEGIVGIESIATGPISFSSLKVSKVLHVLWCPW